MSFSPTVIMYTNQQGGAAPYIDVPVKIVAGDGTAAIFTAPPGVGALAHLLFRNRLSLRFAVLRRVHDVAQAARDLPRTGRQHHAYAAERHNLPALGRPVSRRRRALHSCKLNASVWVHVSCFARRSARILEGRTCSWVACRTSCSCSSIPSQPRGCFTTTRWACATKHLRPLNLQVDELPSQLHQSWSAGLACQRRRRCVFGERLVQVHRPSACAVLSRQIGSDS